METTSKIVCLSTLGVSTGYIVEQLLQAFPAMQLIRLRCQPPVRSTWNRLRKMTVARSWRRLEERLFYSGHHARGSEQVQRLLYGHRPVPALPAVTELRTSEVNHPSTAELIHSLDPDVMITVGAPLLKPQIFSIPRRGTINIHFGIAPYYRGEETLFWPLYYRDEHQLGVTIHQIDRGIDTGPTLAQGFVDVDSDDTEWTLEAKTARLGADLLVDLLREQQLEPYWQPPRTTLGRQFNYKSRHLWHDAWMFARRYWLQEPRPSCRQRINNYCQPSCDEIDASSAIDCAANC